MNAAPTVTDADDTILPVTRTQSGSCQHEFNVEGAVSWAKVEISFLKQNKSSAVDISMDNIQKNAIVGQIPADSTGNITDNYYVGDDIFGIDNISYAGVAEPISYNELLRVEHLPTDFWHLKVTCRIEDTYLGTQEVKFGESLTLLNVTLGD